MAYWRVLQGVLASHVTLNRSFQFVECQAVDLVCKIYSCSNFPTFDCDIGGPCTKREEWGLKQFCMCLWCVDDRSNWMVPVTISWASVSQLCPVHSWYREDYCWYG